MIHRESRDSLRNAGPRKSRNKRDPGTMNTNTFHLDLAKEFAEQLTRCMWWDQIRDCMVFSGDIDYRLELAGQDRCEGPFRATFWITEGYGFSDVIEIDSFEVGFANPAPRMEANGKGQAHPRLFRFERLVDRHDVVIGQFNFYTGRGAFNPHAIARITRCHAASNGVPHDETQNLQVAQSRGPANPGFLAPIDEAEGVLVGELARRQDIDLAQVAAEPVPALKVAFQRQIVRAMSVEKALGPVIPFFAIVSGIHLEFFRCLQGALGTSPLCLARIVHEQLQRLATHFAIHRLFQPPVRGSFSPIKRSHLRSVPAVPYRAQSKRLGLTPTEAI